MDYPFKKMHSREFSEQEIISNLITFAHSFYFNNNNHANNNHSNDNRICDTNPMINSNWDTQSQDWSISEQSKEKI